jgi:hypothetical protein
MKLCHRGLFRCKERLQCAVSFLVCCCSGGRGRGSCEYPLPPPVPAGVRRAGGRSQELQHRRSQIEGAETRRSSGVDNGEVDIISVLNDTIMYIHTARLSLQIDSMYLF